MTDPKPMTTAGLQAKVALRRAWFDAHPSQPIPEARDEVEALFLAIEREAAAGVSVPTEPGAPREHDPNLWADCAESRCPHVASVQPVPFGVPTEPGAPDPATSFQMPVALIRSEWPPNPDLVPGGSTRFDAVYDSLSRGEPIHTPITVKWQDFTVIDGMHRLTAARLLGLASIPVRVWTGHEWVPASRPVPAPEPSARLREVVAEMFTDPVTGKPNKRGWFMTNELAESIRALAATPQDPEA